MFGTYQHTIDAKGRLFVPSKLRDALGEAFYVTLGPDRCLSVYTQQSWDGIMERYNALPLSKQGNMRMLLAKCCKCEPDKQGRFLLPQELRDYARLQQEVTFIGQGNHAEIWDTARYTEMEQEQLTPENLLRMMEELGF